MKQFWVKKDYAAKLPFMLALRAMELCKTK